MSAFIEWRAEEDDTGRSHKQPYLIAAEGEALAVAAIWDKWGSGDEMIESCALVTTAAAPEFQRVHKRMPVLLGADECERWLDVSAPIARDDPLFTPVLKRPFRVQPLSRAVNNARNKDVALMAPTGEGFRLAAGAA